jgi:hypothetical protein
MSRIIFRKLLALHDSDVVEHCGVETTYEDVY